MVEQHKLLKWPLDKKVRVWRYMDFAKFISLLATSKLFLTRVDNLEDKFEGSVSELNLLYREIIPQGIPVKAINSYKKLISERGNINKSLKEKMAVNCWHLNEYESAAMWKLYSYSNGGIAIQSTFESLKSSIVDEKIIFIGLVNYLDYQNDFINDGNIFIPFFTKRKSFIHERELRVLFSSLKDEIKNGGVFVEVDLKIMIDKVYISPYSPKWHEDLIESLIHKYGYDFTVVHSDFNKDAVF